MELFYKNDLNSLYYGDAAKMDKIPDKSIDCILTDPPYGIDYVSGMRKESINGLHSAIKDDGEFPRKLMNDCLWEFYRVLKLDTAMYLFTRWDVQDKLKKVITDSQLKFTLKNVLIWVKEGGSMGDLYGDYGNEYESCLFLSYGKHELYGIREGNVLCFKRVNTQEMVHPTQKPVSLIAHILSKSCGKDSTVLDCFAGSGTTLVAATLLGIKSIGIEINEQYLEVAKHRLELAYNSRLTSNITTYAENKYNNHDFTLDYK